MAQPQMPPEPIGRHQLLIFDTGAIREIVLAQAREVGLRLKENPKFLNDPYSYERCTKFIGHFKDKTTSASVVAELYHWIRDKKGRESNIWKLVYDEFRRMSMDEEVVRLLDIDLDLISRFGPTDGSLLELSRRNSSRKPTILTIDSPLHGLCKKAGLNVSTVQEITLQVR